MNKSFSIKFVIDNVFSNQQWTVCHGRLERLSRKRGRPRQEVEHLFKVVGEKIPFEALGEVKHHLRDHGYSQQGVYVAHDSMGCPRYIGRGNIFTRLQQRKNAQVLELEYFSFYVVADKKHEREIETLLIRTAGFLLEFNTAKKRVGLEPGNIRDYEAGTVFYERQYKKGKRVVA